MKKLLKDRVFWFYVFLVVYACIASFFFDIYETGMVLKFLSVSSIMLAAFLATTTAAWRWGLARALGTLFALIAVITTISIARTSVETYISSIFLMSNSFLAIVSIFTSLIIYQQDKERRVTAQYAAEIKEKANTLSLELTERKQTEAKLKKTLDALARSNAELERFAYISSHDLQEPLRMVASYTQLLERRYKDKLDDNANEFIAFAVEGATRMQGMINDLLAYSRISRKGGEFEPVELEPVLEKALANLRLSIEESGAVIKHDSLPIITADGSQMAQLFQNLIGNAIKFRRNGNKPKVQIFTEKRKDEWLFTVKDNGMGIKKEDFERIFQVFQRLNGKNYAGTGIGLSIAKRIVNRHGGIIWVESEIKKGSSFYFTIPLKAGGKNEYDGTGATDRNIAG